LVYILAVISVTTPTPMQLPPPPPSSGTSSQFQMTPPPHSERSEAVGSERRDETVMGPPPKSGTTYGTLNLLYLEIESRISFKG